MTKGQKVWFDNIKKPFKVREANDKYAICTMPYNFKPNTVIYTIVDFERKERGLDNMVFGIHDYFSDDDCRQAFEELNIGELAVSYRRCVPLHITKLLP